MAAAGEWVIRSRRAVTPQGVCPAAVRVRAGRIVAVEPYGAAAAAPAGARAGAASGVMDGGGAGSETFDAGDAVLMPGLVDSHVHVNEPGRTEWEGFETATRAAAAGGITTIADMPLNSIPVTTTPEALAVKAEAAARGAHVDFTLWGGVVPGNTAALEAMIDAGVPGFKCFLVHSGIDEFPNVVESDLRAAMPILARRGVPLLVHAELPGPIEAAERARARADFGADGGGGVVVGGGGGGPMRRYADYLASRPAAAEDEAVALVLRLAAETGCRVHIVHLSSAGALGALAAARARGIAVTVETCPHYLTFTAEDIPDGATLYKCAPPIREGDNRERLWAGLAAGHIDLVVSDHSPCAPEHKALEAGDYAQAWGGISSLQLALPATWTAARARGFGLDRLAAWMCAAPAALCGLGRRKGALAPGMDADFVVWHPERSFTVAPEQLRFRHAHTPYEGRTLNGVVEKTFLRGELVYDAASVDARAGAGAAAVADSVDGAAGSGAAPAPATRGTWLKPVA
ncbi:MAG TPA: amidohydrolase family protein [Myxococcota bacterium]|jgi:allantoinase|nr:amidohydrolase family protein [Myxococcota bacterium]